MQPNFYIGEREIFLIVGGTLLLRESNMSYDLLEALYAESMRFPTLGDYLNDLLEDYCESFLLLFWFIFSQEILELKWYFPKIFARK